MSCPQVLVAGGHQAPASRHCSARDPLGPWCGRPCSAPHVLAASLGMEGCAQSPFPWMAIVSRSMDPVLGGLARVTCPQPHAEAELAVPCICPRSCWHCCRHSAFPLAPLEQWVTSRPPSWSWRWKTPGLGSVLLQSSAPGPRDRGGALPPPLAPLQRAVRSRRRNMAPGSFRHPPALDGPRAPAVLGPPWPLVSNRGMGGPG